MPFRLSNDGEKWFKDISKSTKNGFQTDFDAYYFCFIAGIICGQKKSLSVEIWSEHFTHISHGLMKNVRSREKGFSPAENQLLSFLSLTFCCRRIDSGEI